MSSYDLSQIKERIPLADACRREGIALARKGALLWGACPFHAGRKHTFSIADATPHRARCWDASCGWNGDVIEFFEKMRGIGKREAIEQLAQLAGLSPLKEGAQWKDPKPKMRALPLAVKEKPWMPPLRALTNEEMERLSNGRRGKFGLRLPLPMEGIRLAAAEKMIAYTEWPRDKESGKPTSRSAPAWAITDNARWMASFRRLNGDAWMDGVKALALQGGAARWLIGVENLRGRKQVILTEGAPDAVAAWGIIAAAGAENRAAVGCMLSGEYSLLPENVEMLRGCRVRICMDNDAPRERKLARGVVMERAGARAAARWLWQLKEAGIDAAIFDFSEVMTEGEKDLCDLVCSAGLEGLDCEGMLDF